VEGDIVERDQWHGHAAAGKGPLHHPATVQRRRQDLWTGVRYHQFDCADPEIETSAKILSWRLQCRGQLDADVAARFNFDTPQHYTATITFQRRMGGALINDTKTEVVGERIGDCQQ
jgi:hypothetical protein